MTCQNHHGAIPVGKLFVASLEEGENNGSQACAVPVGKNFRYVVPYGMTQIIDPNSNTNGVIIRTASCTPSNGWVTLYTGASTPSGAHDPDNPIIFGSAGNSTSGGNAIVWLPYPLYIPAGQGVWGLNSGAGEISMTWDVL